MTVEPRHCFVYGTLKWGQSNYPLIAESVRAALPATIRGRLYDVGRFPALTHGNETVHGELLLIAPEALADVLVALDDLEGYDAADPAGSFYLREIVAATTADGQEHASYIYFYNGDTAELPYLPGGAWPGPHAATSADPAGESDEPAPAAHHDTADAKQQGAQPDAAPSAQARLFGMDVADS